MSWDKHPKVRTGDELTPGERVADASVRVMGSWGFIIGQAVFIAAWMILNVVAWCAHWDPRPWIMLNLLFSIQAAFAAPLILLAARRQDTRNAEVANSDHRMLIAICERLGVPTEDPAEECLQEDPRGVPSGGPLIGVADVAEVQAAAGRYYRRMYDWNAVGEHSDDCPGHCICWGPTAESECQ